VTAALQALYVSGVSLTIDKSCVIDTLLMPSNSHIHFGPGVTVTKKPAPNSGRGVLRNANFVGGPTAPTDTNIAISMDPTALLDGNRRNRGSGTTSGSGEAYIANPDDEIVSVIELYGVDGVILVGLNLHDSPGYGIHMSNIRRLFCYDYSKTIAPGDTMYGNDNFHVNGHSDRVFARKLSGETEDDFIAISANDGNDLYPGTSGITFNAAVVSGPISKVAIEDVDITYNSAHVARLMSATATNYLEDIRLRRVRTLVEITNTNPGIYFDNFTVPGSGDYRSIEIEDCEVRRNGEVVEVRNANIGYLKIKGMLAPVAHTGGMVRIDFYGKVGELDISDSTTAATNLVKLDTGGYLNCLYSEGNTPATNSGTIHEVRRAYQPRIIVQDDFAGTAGQSLAGTPPLIGPNWSSAPGDAFQGAAVSDIKRVGNGFTYNASSSSSLMLTPARIGERGVVWEADFKFLSRRTSGTYQTHVSMLSDTTPTFDSSLMYREAPQDWYFNDPTGLIVQLAYPFPTAGTVIRVRQRVSHGSFRRYLTEFSTDGGQTWAVQFGGPKVVTGTTSNPFRLGLWYDGTQTGVNGVQIGNIVARTTVDPAGRASATVDGPTRLNVGEVSDEYTYTLDRPSLAGDVVWVYGADDFNVTSSGVTVTGGAEVGVIAIKLDAGVTEITFTATWETEGAHSLAFANGQLWTDPVPLLVEASSYALDIVAAINASTLAADVAVAKEQATAANAQLPEIVDGLASTNAAIGGFVGTVNDYHELVATGLSAMGDQQTQDMQTISGQFADVITAVGTRATPGDVSPTINFTPVINPTPVAGGFETADRQNLTGLATSYAAIATSLGQLTTTTSEIGGSVAAILQMTSGNGSNRAFTPTALANAPATSNAISDGDKADIADRVGTLLSGRKLIISSPVITDEDGEQRLELYAGDAYPAGRPIRFTVEDYIDEPINNVPAVLRLIESTEFATKGSLGVAVAEFEATIVQTGTTLTISFTASSAATAAITSTYPAASAPTHQAQVIVPSIERTLIDIPATVKRRIKP
jgi:hypothetical protein